MKYYFLLLSLLFIRCQKENNSGSATLPEKTMMNVSYGTDAAQKMDVYLPTGRDASTKVIILVHPGGWNTGDKSDFNPYVDTLKRRLSDHAIFNINYRLSTGSINLFPTQENDVKAAVDFIISKTNEYNISDKLVLIGASAGAHLSLLQAYKYSTPKIKAVVDFFGPADLTDMYNNPAPLAPPAALALIIGATPISNPTIYQQSSPIDYVSDQSPPTIILQGGLDVLVSPTQSLNLKNKLQSFGVATQYVYYPTENHGWFGANLSDSFDKIVVFLNANVK